MHWKTFFRPGWKKLLVFAALVILDIFVKTPTSGCFDYCQPGAACPAVCSPTPLFFMPVAAFSWSSNIAPLIFENFVVVSAALLVFWYFVACCFLRLHHERKHNDRQERNKK